MSGSLSNGAEALRRRAADMAANLSRTASRSATIAQERALLRMLGVDGLDRAGRPLAASLAETYFGSDAGRLAKGIVLPFAVALIEYEMGPRELALDIASEAIDLGLEGELLQRPGRLAAAGTLAGEMIESALARFDANRTATHEMRDVLGLPAEPLLGVYLEPAEVVAASAGARAIVDQGGDVVQVRVPASWEFAQARRQAGLETPGLFEVDAPSGRREGRRGGRRGKVKTQPVLAEPVPAGSQRGLAGLRKAVDEAAAERGSYAALMTVTSAFAAPEQAVVAAFERIDYVAADPIREIVEDNVDPERALADHAFAHRLQARAGSRVVLGPGPLALGADLATGVPSDAATRAGRALALQALGVELALADGLPADRLLLGAVPAWAGGDGESGSIFLQTWLRRILFPGLGMVVDGPSGGLASPGGAVGLVSALAGGPAALVMQAGLGARVGAAATDLAAAARAAAELRSALGGAALHGEAADFAARTLRAAVSAMEALADEGWASMLGPVGADSEGSRLGRSAAVERADGPGSGARLLRDLL